MPRKPPVRWKVLSQFCRQVGVALAAGIDIRKILNDQAKTSPQRYRDTFRTLARAVASGESISDVLEEDQLGFPTLAAQFIKVGDRSGRLAEVFQRLADHYDFMLQLRRMSLVATFWPGFMFIATLLIVFVIILLSGWISDLTGTATDFLGFGLVGTAGALKYLTFVCATILLCGALVRFVKSKCLGVDRLLLLITRLPMIGGAIRSMALSQVSWTIALASECGMTARETVRAALQSTDNYVYTRHIEDTTRRVAEGMEINEALTLSKAFPDEFLRMLTVGEQSGRISETMYTLAAQYKSKTQAVAGGLIAGGALLTWVAAATLLIFLIFRLFSFYTQTIRSMSEF